MKAARVNQPWMAIAVAAIAAASTWGCSGYALPCPADGDDAACEAAGCVTPSTPLEPALVKSLASDGGVLIVDDEIHRACRLGTVRIRRDGYAMIEPPTDALAALATCATTGALAQHQLTLVGHADPRGNPEANFRLGQRRAKAVALYLLARGVSPARMLTFSRGDGEAVGTDEVGWAFDRRVEIRAHRMNHGI